MKSPRKGVGTGLGLGEEVQLFSTNSETTIAPPRDARFLCRDVQFIATATDLLEGVYGAWGDWEAYSLFFQEHFEIPLSLFATTLDRCLPSEIVYRYERLGPLGDPHELMERMKSREA